MDKEKLQQIYQTYIYLKTEPAAMYSVSLQMAAKSLDIFFEQVKEDFEKAKEKEKK